MTSLVGCVFFHWEYFLWHWYYYQRMLSKRCQAEICQNQTISGLLKHSHLFPFHELAQYSPMALQSAHSWQHQRISCYSLRVCWFSLVKFNLRSQKEYESKIVWMKKSFIFLCYEFICPSWTKTSLCKDAVLNMGFHYFWIFSLWSYGSRS